MELLSLCHVQVCANAFCEDHLPGDSHLTVNCKRFQALGQIHPKQVLTQKKSYVIV